jgi:MoaA/NifB/PqqE/SkfB family radical SAM enzyme
MHAAEPSHRVDRFGPLETQAVVGGWRIKAITVAAGQTNLWIEDESRRYVELSIAQLGPTGPFDVGPVRIAYRKTAIPYPAFAPAGLAIASILRTAAEGSDLGARMAEWTAAALAAPGVPPSLPEPGWADRLRQTLLGHPERWLPLAHLMRPNELPPWPCVLPWVKLEYGGRHTFGPCCNDFQTSIAQDFTGKAPLDHWRSAPMRAFRRALAGSGHPETCRPTCPWLAGGSMRADSVLLHGGPPAFVENQVKVVEDLLLGREEVAATPLGLTFQTTTYCNYDCLMCEYGEVGTLDDEVPERFYWELEDIFPGLHHLEALGGEPLASPVFRRFLRDFDFARYPQLRVSLITNLSYFTPEEQDRMAHVPFDNIIASLNAATVDTYAAVNRGLSFGRIRSHLDALLKRRALTGHVEGIMYSMVLLKRNLDEIEAFARLARADGVDVRFMLPMNNRNDQSILTSQAAMEEACAALARVVEEELASGRVESARRIGGELHVLKDRLERRVFRPIPDTPEEQVTRLTLRRPDASLGRVPAGDYPAVHGSTEMKEV